MWDNVPVAGLNGKQPTPELSPRSMPKSTHEIPAERGIDSAEPYNPFASAEEHLSPSSYYSPQYISEEKAEPEEEITFGNVDWAIQKPEPLRTRTISNLQEVKMMDLTPSRQFQTKPPFYRPSDSPPSHPSSPPEPANPANKPGLGIKFDQNHLSPTDEKDPSGITTPPLTYYNPYRQENFRTNLDDEKQIWDQPQENSSTLQPFPEFEDVELARPKPRGFLPAPIPVVQVRSTRSEVCFWLTCAIIFLVPFGIALGVFGGVYHWNIRDERCSFSGGTWNQASNSCQYP